MKIKRSNKCSTKCSTMQNVYVFYLREKIIDFLEIIPICYMRLNTRQNMEGVSKY